MAFDLGSRIVELRAGRNLSQEALANELGLSRQAVSRWERGEALPDTENLIALADLFGVTLDELVRPKETASAETPTTEPDTEHVAIAVEIVEPAEAEDTADEAEDSSESEPTPEAEVDPEPAADAEAEVGSVPVPEPEPAPTGVPAPVPPGIQSEKRWTPGKILAVVGIGVLLAIALSILLRFVGGFLYSYLPFSHIIDKTETQGTETTIDEDSVDVDTSGGITDIDVSWPSGDLTVMRVPDEDTGGHIRIMQNRFDATADNGLSWELSGHELRVFCDPGVRHIGETSLAVWIPDSVAEGIEDLSVEMLSGNCSVQGLTAENLDITIASGVAYVDGVEASELDLEVGSGEAHVEGAFEGIEVDVASGSVELTSQSWPRLALVSAEVASGELTVHLPENTGFTLQQEAVGPGTVHVGFPIVYDERTGVVGDGHVAIRVSVASGSVEIVPYPE